MQKIIKPKRIRIEASSLCQLHCPCCTTASRKIEPGIGFGYLKLRNFKKVVDDNPYLKEIELSNFGEMFLNPELIDIMQYACKKGIRLTADNGVNCNNVTEELLEGLVKYRFYRMTISIDGATQQTYAQYRVQGHFDTVIENIKKINSYKKKYNSPCPSITWQFIVFGHNEHEIPEAKKMASELGMAFHPKLSWDPDFSPVKDSDFVKRVTGLAAVDRSEYKKITGKNYAHAICHQLWEEPQINWDGRLLGCCWNYWSNFSGNVFVQGLLYCLNGEEIRYARDMLMNKKPFRDDLPCSTCDVYLEMSSEKRWLRRGLKRKAYLAVKNLYFRWRLARWF